MREEPTPLPTPLNQLSDAQLHTLADAVEAQNPWSGFAYHAICTTRRFMVTIWALVIFPYVSPNLWIAAIFCGMALVFDLLVSSKSPDMTITPRDVVFHFAEHWDDDYNRFNYVIYSWWHWAIPIIVLGTINTAISYGCGLYFISPTTAHWMIIFTTIAIIGWMSRYFLEKIFNVKGHFQVVHNFNRATKSWYRFSLPHLAAAIPIALLAVPVYVLCLFQIPYSKIFKIMLSYGVIIVSVMVLTVLLNLMPVFILLRYSNMCADRDGVMTLEGNIVIGFAMFSLIFFNMLWLGHQRRKYFYVANAILKHYGIHFSQTSQSTA